ncbi:hypothetical protein B0H10DRAFT_2229974 [Mycena sp. CBHHK59/15]|nr:hypothetical protein B0H10DRAFT_2229974 [Mycena sp. CBHHK59/15]
MSSDILIGSFRNTCGRTGCTHVFEYEGPKPLDNISAMVNAHSADCIGHIIGCIFAAVHRYQTRSLTHRQCKAVRQAEEEATQYDYGREWHHGRGSSVPSPPRSTDATPPAVPAQAPVVHKTHKKAPSATMRTAHNTPVATPNAIQAHTAPTPGGYAPPVTIRTSNNTPVAAQNAIQAHTAPTPGGYAPPVTIRTSDNTPVAAQSQTHIIQGGGESVQFATIRNDDSAATTDPSQARAVKKKGTKRVSSSPSRTGSNTSDPAANKERAGGKKSARSEKERRLVLETDEWSVKATAHDVVCRGCENTIKLDRRSRFYPGLWEKHRNRCEGIKRKRREELAKARLLESQMTNPVPEPLYEPTTLFKRPTQTAQTTGDSDTTADTSGLAPGPRKSYYREHRQQL